MAARKARARAPIARARFLKWLSGAVAAANADWRRRRPDLGGEVLGREELLFHLLRWAVADQRLDAVQSRKRPSIAVAIVHQADPEAVVAEARRYWRLKFKEAST